MLHSQTLEYFLKAAKAYEASLVAKGETKGRAYMLMVYRLQTWRAQGQIDQKVYRSIIEANRLTRTTGIDYKRRR